MHGYALLTAAMIFTGHLAWANVLLVCYGFAYFADKFILQGAIGRDIACMIGFKGAFFFLVAVDYHGKTSCIVLNALFGMDDG